MSHPGAPVHVSFDYIFGYSQMCLFPPLNFKIFKDKFHILIFFPTEKLEIVGTQWYLLIKKGLYKGKPVQFSIVIMKYCYPCT